MIKKNYKRKNNKKKLYKKKAYKSKIYKPVPDNTHYFRITRKVMDQIVSTPYQGGGGPSPGTQTQFKINFSLNTLPNYTDFVNTFMMYKIRKIKLDFQPTQTSVITAGSGGGGDINEIQPLVYIITDQSGTENPISIADMLQYDNVRYHKMGTRFTMVISPRVSEYVYKTTLASSYAVPNKPLFINTANNDIPHYGIIGVLEEGQTGAWYRYNIVITYYLTFKHTR